MFVMSKCSTWARGPTKMVALCLYVSLWRKPSNLLSPALSFGFTGKVMACAVMQPRQI